MRQYVIAPTRVVWKSPTGVERAENLLKKSRGQSLLDDPVAACVLTSAEGKPAGIVLDFGVEIQGSVEIFTPMTAEKNAPTLRIRTGESVME